MFRNAHEIYVCHLVIAKEVIVYLSDSARLTEC